MVVAALQLGPFSQPLNLYTAATGVSISAETAEEAGVSLPDDALVREIWERQQGEKDEEVGEEEGWDEDLRGSGGGGSREGGGSASSEQQLLQSLAGAGNQPVQRPSTPLGGSSAVQSSSSGGSGGSGSGAPTRPAWGSGLMKAAAAARKSAGARPAAPAVVVTEPVVSDPVVVDPLVLEPIGSDARSGSHDDGERSPRFDSRASAASVIREQRKRVVSSPQGGTAQSAPAARGSGGGARGGSGGGARAMTLSELRDVAERKGLDLEGLLEGARAKGVVILDE